MRLHDNTPRGANNKWGEGEEASGRGGNEPNFDSRFVGIEATGISCGVWMQHHIVVITYNLAAALVAVYRVIRSSQKP